MKPILSIIIINYKTAELTAECLKSIVSDKGLEFDLADNNSSSLIPTEIILIDNNSNDDIFDRVKTQKVTIKTIANDENLGFARANNQGINIAQGNYILLLNSDTIILHSAISQSLNWLSSHPEAYGCTAQLLNKDKSIQASGGYFPNIDNIFTWCTGLDDLPMVNKIIRPFHPHTPDFYTHDKYYCNDHQQDWVTAAFLLVRTNIIKDVQGFDPNYFMYGDEVELCYRINKTHPSLQLWYLVGPQIIHIGGASSQSIQFAYNKEYEGILSFFNKHKSRFQLELVRGFIIINRIFRKTIYSIFKNA